MDAAALLCNICPKNPRFSDVSHLLTHVSSKAHLSNYFKLQVRSHQESHAETLLDEYNQWYKMNNLAKLLSDRMSSKDSRKKKVQERAIIQDKASDTERNDRFAKATPSTTYPAYTSAPEYLDPRLSDHFQNVEFVPGHRETSHPAYYKPLDSPTIVSNQAYRPFGNASDPAASPSDLSGLPVFRRWKHGKEFDSEDEKASCMHATPRWFRDFNIKPEPDTRSLNVQFSYDPFVDENDSTEYLNSSEMDKERADEIARLKGVLWPGMDIFDSATEQMRRKRNQKKDASILKMMEMTSLRVEPTELVFSPTGVLRKQRVISGNVEDSSPLKGETPIPKRRVTRPKRVLSQVDPNVPRGPEGKRSRKKPRREPTTFEEDLNQRSVRTSLAQPIFCYGNYASQGDDLEEFALSVTDQRPKYGNKLAVFCDVPCLRQSKPEGTHCGERILCEESAASQSLLLQQGATTYGGFKSPNLISCVTNSVERGSRVATDKENIEPLLNVYGQIDAVVGWNSPAMKRNLTADVGLPPQYFFADAQHTGFGLFENHLSAAGYSYNPLAGSFSRNYAEENPIYSAESSRPCKTQPTASVNSPEATISDVGDDDFERLYLDGSVC